MHDEEFEEKPKSVFWHIIGACLAVLIILMIMPAATIRLNPEPHTSVSLMDVQDKFQLDKDSLVENVDRGDYAGLVSVDTQTKAIADYIVTESCEGFDRVCYAKSLYYFVRDEFQYVNDPTAFEYVKTASESFVSGGGDCDDSSVALASLLQAVGIRVRLVFVPGHVFVEGFLPEAINRYKVEDHWVVMDGTCRSCDFGELAYQYSSVEKRYQSL